MIFFCCFASVYGCAFLVSILSHCVCVVWSLHMMQLLQMILITLPPAISAVFNPYPWALTCPGYSPIFILNIPFKYPIIYMKIIHLPIDSFTHSSFIHSFGHSIIQSFSHSFTHSSIHVIIQPSSIHNNLSVHV